jgi:hypothetical protein
MSKFIYDSRGFDSNPVIDALGYIQIVSSTLMFIFWIIIKARLIVLKGWRDLVEVELIILFIFYLFFIFNLLIAE